MCLPGLVLVDTVHDAKPALLQRPYTMGIMVRFLIVDTAGIISSTLGFIWGFPRIGDPNVAP